MPRTSNYILIRYCRCVRIKKRERRVIDGQKQYLNSDHSTDCAGITISEDAADELIATAIYARDLTYFSDDDADGFIVSVNSENSMYCADITISDYATGELIATAINAGNSTDFSDFAAGGLITAINSGYLMDCALILRFQMMQRMD